MNSRRIDGIPSLKPSFECGRAGFCAERRRHRVTKRTVAGACSVVLKAMFDENSLMLDCVHASADGLSLEPCPPGLVPTIGNEINKLRVVVATARESRQLLWQVHSSRQHRRPPPLFPLGTSPP